MKNEDFISVVVPVYNGGAQLKKCLDALLSSAHREREIIVVDDGSTDESARVADEAKGVRLLRLASRRGPAAARNQGARAARGSVLLFVDADVVVRQETVGRVAEFLRENRDVAAVFGSYDDAPSEQNLVSQYKNLLHHFVHQQSNGEAETFWAGCGAVRREVFMRVGGFDERRYREASIEDIELGYRLRAGGHRVRLERELQVKHLKRWTLATLLRADIFRRALPWSKLIFERRGMINDLNLRVADRVSAALVGLALAFLLLSPAAPLLLAPALASVAVVILLQRNLYGFFLRRRGLVFTVGACAMHLLYLFYSGVVFVLCRIKHAASRKRTVLPDKAGDWQTN